MKQRKLWTMLLRSVFANTKKKKRQLEELAGSNKHILKPCGGVWIDFLPLWPSSALGLFPLGRFLGFHLLPGMKEPGIAF